MNTERLWNQRRGHVGYTLLIIGVAAGATLAATITVPITAIDLVGFAALGAMGVIEAELARQIERVRQRPDRALHINMTSVWILPAVLLISPAMVAVLVAGLHWHLYRRGWYRQKRVPVYRTVSATSVLIVTSYAVRIALAAMGFDGVRDAVDAGWAGAAALAAGIGIFVAVPAVLVMLALHTLGRGPFTGWPGGVLLEVATLVLGTMLAVMLVTVPALAGLIILPVVLLHRAVLVEQFEAAARQDAKTGVLNMAGWHRIANQELSRNGGSFGVLMIDLDHFKRINDCYGHLAGDVVLKTVADTISATVRREDQVGRFGGEEFVVLLEMAPRAVFEVAERIRVAIARLEIPVPVDGRIDGLSASIGIATGPASGTKVEQLLLSADAALYQAKASGRNRVVCAS